MFYNIVGSQAYCRTVVDKRIPKHGGTLRLKF